MGISRERLLIYLGLLNDELTKINVRGELIFAEGASMCLAHDTDDASKDIDALYEPKKIVTTLASKIAIEQNVSPNYLNEAAKGLAGSDIKEENFLNFSNLNIYAVTSEYLLCMKLMVSRYNTQDENDIKFLLKKLNITDKDKILELLLRYFKEEDILPKTTDTIMSLLEDLDGGQT
ncbi:MAG: hypothetical protein LBF38_01170 [Deltaproteobacteria bacterium]|jgi:hypothetical protein|nr:hypothetical protein [Deltaproteobacteria bacterium]